MGFVSRQPILGQRPRTGGPWSNKAADAIKEIQEQLFHQGGTGKVWVDNWRKRFKPELGTLREFLVARGDKFDVQHCCGKRFTVSLLPDELAAMTTQEAERACKGYQAHAYEEPTLEEKKIKKSKRRLGGTRWHARRL